MSEIKYIDIQELVDNGYVQEVNRRFFHLLGLNLEINKSDSGELQFVGIADFRDDEEGLVFDEVDVEKVKNVQKEIDRKIEARQKAFGWFLQPYEISDSSEQDNS